MNAHHNLGTALAHQGELEEAVGHFVQALRYMPEHADAHGNLGAALARLGRPDEALAHVEEA